MHWFEAAGIPITPVDDAGQRNPYPLMRLTAKTTGGTVLATTDVVLPVSSEMDCRACHASGSGDAAKPAGGWVNEPDPARDHRLNILRLHDRHLDTQPYDDALAAKGYPPEGLEASVRDQSRNPSSAPPATPPKRSARRVFRSVNPLTRSMHSMHAEVIAPDTGMTLNDIANRSSCYQCHPGSETRCLRGAMGAAVAADGSASMQCQSCHGTMSQVGAADRTGWLDEPNCQQCHTGSATQNSGQLRYTSVFDKTTARRGFLLARCSPPIPTPRPPAISLYRFSKGHGGLQCSACHGSTHAEFPAQPPQRQPAEHRRAGPRRHPVQLHLLPRHRCPPPSAAARTACTRPARTGSTATRTTAKAAPASACHGADLRGTPLSRSFSDQTLIVQPMTASPHSIPLFRGANVSCFLCHKREDDGGLGGALHHQRPTRRHQHASLVTAVNTPGSVDASIKRPEWQRAHLAHRQPAAARHRGLVRQHRHLFPGSRFRRCRTRSPSPRSTASRTRTSASSASRSAIPPPSPRSTATATNGRISWNTRSASPSAIPTRRSRRRWHSAISAAPATGP